MKNRIRQSALLVVAVAFTFLSTSSHALRCGNKLIKNGMHEVQIRELCGDPVSVQSLGFVLRYYNPYNDHRNLTHYTNYYGYGARQELLVTEMLFNFGPHKLMRRLRFEGGRLASIDTEGYGYHEKN